MILISRVSFSGNFSSVAFCVFLMKRAERKCIEENGLKRPLEKAVMSL